MCIVKKLIFIVHSKKSNHENKNEIMKLKSKYCLMSASYIQYPRFREQIFRKLIIMNEPSLP